MRGSSYRIVAVGGRGSEVRTEIIVQCIIFLAYKVKYFHLIFLNSVDSLQYLCRKLKKYRKALSEHFIF